MGLLTIIGLCIFGGVLGVWLFQKLHVPKMIDCDDPATIYKLLTETE